MIHPSAVVEAGVELGDEVEIGAFSYLQSGARVGAGSKIGPHVTVFGCAEIGERCQLHAGAVVGDLPQDLGYDGADSGVEIGDECRIREGVTVNRGTRAGTLTKVGARCMLMANSHVGHNVNLGESVIAANGVAFGGYAEIGDRAFFGGNAMVHQFCKVGRLAMIAGFSVIVSDVPPFLMTRNLTSGVIGLNSVGLRRAGVSAEDRVALKRAFQLLYRSKLNRAQALERIRGDASSDLVEELCGFVEASERGIAKYIGRDASLQYRTDAS